VIAMLMRPFRILATGTALAVMAAACAPTETPRGRTVTAAWARAADSGATGGAYLTIVNHDSVTVELVAVATALAASAEVHESMQHDGMSHMMPRASVAIGARDSLVMAPGGLHVMLNQLTRALAAGDSVPLTVRFSNGDSVLVRVPVRAP
jgi:copper(I)-binding protein